MEQRFLDDQGYRMAPVTLDNSDYMYATLYAGVEHRERVRFVTLDEALGDGAYRLPDEYVGRGGFSWIHRWSKTKNMPAKGEPDPPAWVTSAFGAR